MPSPGQVATLQRILCAAGLPAGDQPTFKKGHINMTTFNVVWTPKNHGDYVTALAVADGGHICDAFERECEAVAIAGKLNHTSMSSGHYCVQVEGEA